MAALSLRDEDYEGGRGDKIVGGIQFVKSSDDRTSMPKSTDDKNSAHFKSDAPAKPENDHNPCNAYPMQKFVSSGQAENRSLTSTKYFTTPVNGGKFKGPLSQQPVLSRAPLAYPLLTPEQYRKSWQGETDPALVKIRKLAWEVANLKTVRPNAVDKLHSASNRVPLKVEFTTEPVAITRGKHLFRCHVFVEGILAGSGEGPKLKDSKSNAYEIALQRIFMPELRVNKIDTECSALEGSEEPFTSPPPEPSDTVKPNSYAPSPSSLKGGVKPPSLQKDSNIEAVGLKRMMDDQRTLEDFVIVEPLIPIPDCTPAHTLRRSADFNHMLLEYEYTFCGDAVRCIMSVEGEVLADVQGGSKLGARNKASEQGLMKMKEICWVIKTKQAVDSGTKISKDEILNELTDQSEALSEDNVGSKLLKKMGWSGGGVGKDGSGIAEPVVLKSVVNREGLGLGTEKGITDEYRRRVKKVIENYASSGNQEDLVFNCDFRLEERLIIHDECRRLNLKSKCKGKGSGRYLCVRRKRSANMLFNHIMSCGGETIRYKLVPPGKDMGQSSSQGRWILGVSSSDGTNQPSFQQNQQRKSIVNTENSLSTSQSGFTQSDSNSMCPNQEKSELGSIPSLMSIPAANVPALRPILKGEIGESSQPNTQQNSFQSQDGFSQCPGNNEMNSFNDVFINKMSREVVPYFHGLGSGTKRELEPHLNMNGNCSKELRGEATYRMRFNQRNEVDNRRPGPNFSSGNSNQWRGYDYNGNKSQTSSNPSSRRGSGSDSSSRRGSGSDSSNLYNLNTFKRKPANMQNSSTSQGNDGGFHNRPPTPQNQNFQPSAMQRYPVSNSNPGPMNFGGQDQWFCEQQQNQQYQHLWNKMSAQWGAGQQGRNMGRGMQGGHRFNHNGHASRGNWRGRGRMV